MIDLGVMQFASAWALPLLLVLPAWWLWRRRRKTPAIVFSRVRALAKGPKAGRGVTRTLYHATPYPEFITGFVADPHYPRIGIALPPNRSSSLTIRELGVPAGRWWSVHELQLWQRSP